MFTDSWIYRGFMRFDLWTKQHGGQGIDRRKMHSFEFGHLRRDYLGLNIVLHSFIMQRWISMKDHTTLCLHAEFGATHAKPPLSLMSRWNKEHYVHFWQPPDISRSHLYRGTFPWTPTTAIYRAYTVMATPHTGFRVFMTHWGQHIMAAILQMTFSNWCILFQEKLPIFFQASLKIISEGPNDLLSHHWFISWLGGTQVANC